jgi:NhaP-type Na+/H+ or K+/H+ antiporter
MDKVLIGLASIIILGIGAQWLAWRLRLPSILLLLVFGFIAGPVTTLLKPDELFGDLLLPIVSLSVAIILFEGSLNLRLAELRRVGGTVRNLITLGILITWLIGAGAAYLLLDLDLSLSILIGAILVVTGPTVILPLLRYLRPSGQVGLILKWEGITIDPIGAILAVLVFGGIIASTGGPQEAATSVITNLLLTVLVSGVFGAAGAIVIVLFLRSYRIPDFLHSAVTLAVVIGIFTASNLVQTDSGLLAATIMGLALSNQNVVSIRHIMEFKENLRVLLISSLFILLAARLEMNSLTQIISIGSLGFLLALMLVARPLSVLVSTVRSKVNWSERIFLSLMAPRGIVAAAVASVFALRLADAGYPQAEQLIPLTFMVIVVTVAIYGMAAAPLAQWLKIAQPNPQGVLIIGGHNWAKDLGLALKNEGFKVLVADDNWSHIKVARMAGLDTFYASMLSQYARDEIELGGIGRLVALTSDDEFNSLAILQFANIFGRANVYQLPSESEDKGHKEATSDHLRGRLLFDSGITYSYLSKRFSAGAVIKTTNLTEDFDFDSFKTHYGEAAVPLFLVDQNGNLSVFTTDNPPKPQSGQKLISLINPADKNQGKNQPEAVTKP